MILKVRRMSPEERETVMSFVDRAEENGGQKTPWGVFLTNALPLGEIRTISLLLLSCSLVCPQIFGWLRSDLGSYNKMGIFPTVARINHSCKPNAHHFFNPDTGEEEVGVILNWSSKFSSWSPWLSSPPSGAITNIIIITAIGECHSTNYVSLTFLSLVLLCSIPKMSQFCQNTNPFCFTLFIVQLLCPFVSGTTIEAGRPDDLNWSIQHIVNIIKSSTAASIAYNKPNLIRIDK